MSRSGKALGRDGWVPQQHGAWAMVISPLLVGAIASGWSWTQVPLFAFWLLGYFAFNACSLWLKSRRKPRYLPALRSYLVAATILAGVTMALDPRLISWVPWFIAPLGIGLWAAAQRRERDTLAGLATVAGASLMTVVSYAAGPGTDLPSAWLLALVQFCYFGGTVFYVKSAIRQRGSRGYLWLSIGFHGAATAAMVAISWWLVAVFALLTLRAAVVPGRGLSPKQLGIGEIVATVLVAVVALLVT